MSGAILPLPQYASWRGDHLKYTKSLKEAKLSVFIPYDRTRILTQVVKKFPAFYKTSGVYYRLHASQPLVLILNQKNPVHIVTHCSYKIHFILSSHLFHVFQVVSSLQVFRLKFKAVLRYIRK